MKSSINPAFSGYISSLEHFLFFSHTGGFGVFFKENRGVIKNVIAFCGKMQTIFYS